MFFVQLRIALLVFTVVVVELFNVSHSADSSAAGTDVTIVAFSRMVGFSLKVCRIQPVEQDGDDPRMLVSAADMRFAAKCTLVMLFVSHAPSHWAHRPAN